MPRSPNLDTEVGELIDKLEQALIREYGGEFSYLISAQHRVIATHNYRPDIKWPNRTKE